MLLHLYIFANYKLHIQKVMFFKSHDVHTTNPFSLYWKKNWKFQIVHMEGGVQIEAKGLGVSLRAPFLPNDNPIVAADSLILKEENNRRSLYNSWRFQTSNNKLKKTN